MYPIKIGFDGAIKRVEQLIANGHSAEALLTAVFTFEKLLKRSLRVAILARGFNWRQADMILDRKGFKDLSFIWEIYDKEHRRLPELIPNKYWQHMSESVKMRNGIVHGNEVYPLVKCKTFAHHVIAAARALHAQVLADYGADPWKTLVKPGKAMLKWRQIVNVGSKTPSTSAHSKKLKKPFGNKKSAVRFSLKRSKR